MQFPVRRKGEDTRRYTLFEAGLCPLSILPLTLDNGSTQPGGEREGEMGFGAIIAKKRGSSPKRVYSTNCISGSQGRWTLGFCMEAIKSLKSLYRNKFRSEAQENGFQHFGPSSTPKVAYMPKMPILGHIYTWDTKAHIIWHIPQIEGPMVSVQKHTYYGSGPPLDPKSTGSLGARAHKAILCERVARLGKIKQTIHDERPALYFPYCPGSRLIWPLASRTSLGATALLAQFLEEKSSFQATMCWYALNCVEPSLS